jgi:hypothetical protein
VPSLVGMWRRILPFWISNRRGPPPCNGHSAKCQKSQFCPRPASRVWHGLGRVAARRHEARARYAATSRRQTSACWQWDASTQPDWLTTEYYNENIKPRLAKMSGFAIASRIGVSRWYAGRIREGYRPHPRHWKALVELVGIAV